MLILPHCRIGLKLKIQQEVKQIKTAFKYIQFFLILFCHELSPNVMKILKMKNKKHSMGCDNLHIWQHKENGKIKAGFIFTKFRLIAMSFTKST